MHNMALDKVKQFLGALFFIASPLLKVGLSIVLLVIIDTVAAIAYSRKVGFEFSWRLLFKAFRKLGAYGLILSACWIVEIYLIKELHSMGAVAGIIAISELRSILRHVKVATGIDFWALVVDKLKGQYLSKENKDDKK